MGTNGGEGAAPVRLPRLRRAARAWKDGGPCVLIVDGEEPILRRLRPTLAAQGYRVLEVTTGQDALANAGTAHPDLVILDLALPDMEGLEVIRRLRDWSTAPIVILSARNRDEQKIAALDAGADDFLAKPFSIGELLARMRAALRHTPRDGNAPVIATGALTVDVVHRRVTMGDREVALSRVEYLLLRALARSAGKVLAHRELLEEVWGPAFAHNVNLLRVSVSKLRRKIEPDPARPEYILNHAGVGYRLRPPT